MGRYYMRVVANGKRQYILGDVRYNTQWDRTFSIIPEYAPINVKDRIRPYLLNGSDALSDLNEGKPVLLRLICLKRHCCRKHRSVYKVVEFYYSPTTNWWAREVNFTDCTVSQDDPFYQEGLNTAPLGKFPGYVHESLSRAW